MAHARCSQATIPVDRVRDVYDVFKLFERLSDRVKQPLISISGIYSQRPKRSNVSYVSFKRAIPLTLFLFFLFSSLAIFEPFFSRLSLYNRVRGPKAGSSPSLPLLSF